MSPRDKFFVYTRVLPVGSVLFWMYLATKLEINLLALLGPICALILARGAGNLCCPGCGRKLEVIAQADWVNAFSFPRECDECGADLDLDITPGTY